jgi:hypothetical protein
MLPKLPIVPLGDNGPLGVKLVFARYFQDLTLKNSLKNIQNNH